MLRRRRWRAPSPTSSLPFEALTRSHEGAAQIRWATVDLDGIHQNLCNPMWPLSAVSDFDLVAEVSCISVPIMQRRLAEERLWFYVDCACLNKLKKKSGCAHTLTCPSMSIVRVCFRFIIEKIFD